jgi:hypothetical protein
MRANLRYGSVGIGEDDDRAAIIGKIKEQMAPKKEQLGILYCRARSDCEDIGLPNNLPNSHRKMNLEAHRQNYTRGLQVGGLISATTAAVCRNK